MGLWNAKPNIRRLWRARKPARQGNGQAFGRATRRSKRMQRSEFSRWALRMKEMDRRDGVLLRDRGFYFQPICEVRHGGTR
jgi:hypothetical protein